MCIWVCAFYCALHAQTLSIKMYTRTCNRCRSKYCRGKQKNRPDPRLTDCSVEHTRYASHCKNIVNYVHGYVENNVYVIIQTTRFLNTYNSVNGTRWRSLNSKIGKKQKRLLRRKILWFQLVPIRFDSYNSMTALKLFRVRKRYRPHGRTTITGKQIVTNNF